MAANPSNHIAKWEGEWQYAPEATFGTDPTGGNTLLVTGEPSIDLGVSIPEDSGEMGRGTAERYADEYFEGIKAPTVAFETRMDELRALYFFKNLAQCVFNTSAWAVRNTITGGYSYTITPWSGQPSVNIGGTFRKPMKASTTATSSQLAVSGTVVRSIHISSTDGQPVKMSVEGMGVTGSQSTPLSSSVGLSALQGITKFKHFNGYFYVGNSSASPTLTQIYPTSVDVTITNSVAPFYGSSQTPQEFVLGMLGISGSITITGKGGSSSGQGLYEYAQWLAKTSRTIRFEWGQTSGTTDWTDPTTVATTGYVKVACDVIWQKPTWGDANGIVTITLPFIAAKNAYTTTIQVASQTGIT